VVEVVDVVVEVVVEVVVVFIVVVVVDVVVVVVVALLKVAVTALLKFIVKVQVVFVPEQAPDQPANTEPKSGVAVKVTEVPGEYDSEQSKPQLIPTGFEVTIPEPLPDLETVRI
jgi:hypothetical protein